MALIILTEASIEKGFGHVTRMSGVYERIKSQGDQCSVIVDGDAAAKSRYPDYNYIEWTNSEFAFEFFSQDDYVLVDSYHVSSEFLDAINHRCRRLLVIDDNVRLPYHHVTVINPNYFAPYLKYPDSDNMYYLGKDYLLLRKEFCPPGARKLNREVKRVLITFGGTDVLSYTGRVIKALKRNYKDVCLDVVATSAFKNIEQIRGCLNDKDILHMNVSSSEMADLMWQADFAVTSSGGTSNELIKMQCPSAQIAVADNQQNNIRIMSDLGSIMKLEIEKLSAIERMFDYTYRNDMLKQLVSLQSNSSALDLISSIVKGE